MGKARSFSDADDDIVYQTETNDENYVMASQQTAQNLGSTHFSGNSGYGNFSQAGRDQRNMALNGGLFRGNVGFVLQTVLLDISTNTINLLEDASGDSLGQISTDKIVVLSSGSSSDLITILGAQRPGQRLSLLNVFGNTVTIKNTVSATENTITTPGAVDFTLEGNEVVELIYDITTTKWRVVGKSGNGGGGTSFPILYPQDDFGDQGAITLNVDISGTTGQNKTVRMTGDVGFQFTSPPTSTVLEEIWFTFEQDGIGGHNITTTPTGLKNASLLDILLDKSTNAKTTFHFITEDGGTSYRAELVDLVVSSGSQTPWLSNINANNFALNNLSSVQISDISGNTHGLIQGLDTIGVRLSLTPGEEFQIYDNITQIFQIDSTGLNLFGGNLGMGTGGNIIGGGSGEGMTNIGHLDFIDNLATPASAIALYSDGTDLFANTGGSVVNLSDIGEFFGPWTATHDAGNQALQDVSSIQISDTIGNSHGLLQGINTDGVRLTLASGEQFEVVDNITNLMIIDEINGLRLFGHNLNMGTGEIIAGGAGKEINNIGELVFVNNTLSPAGNGILFFDGTDIKAKTGNSTVNLTDIGGSNFTDATFRVTDELDLTKKFAVDVGTNSPGATATLLFGASVDITLSFPNATTIIPGLSTNQTFSGANTFSSNIVAGGSGNGMSNIGNLVFVDNLATPAGIALYSDGTDLFANTSNGVKNLADIGGGSQTPWLSNIDADDFALNNLSSLQISDTSSNTHGLIQGLLNTGVRLTLTSGEEFQIYDNITQIFQIDSSGLNLFGGNLGMGTGGNIIGGGSGEGMTNIGHLDFIDNLATPASALSIYSDGTDVFANTGGGTVNLSDIGGGSQTPWLSPINAAGFTLSNLLSLDIEDSLGATKLGISGPLGVGARFSFVTGDSVFFTENITNRLEINSTGISLLNNNITMGTGEIIAGGAGKEINNIGELVFVNNTLSPAGNGILFFDGTDIKAKTGNSTVNLSDIGGGSSNDGIQESEPPLDDSSAQFNFQMFISNGKQGYEVSKTTSLTEDNIAFVPLYLGKRARITHLGWNNIAAATGTITFAMALYANRVDGQNYPGSLIVQDSSATVTALTQTALTNSLTPTNLEAGLYWIAIIITNLQVGSIVTCSRHDSAGANSVGYYDDAGNTDVMLSLLGFTEPETFMPNPPANDMTPISENPPALFARFIPNTN